MVFDDGHRRVALVGVDALIVPRLLVVGARKRIEDRCDIPGDHVLIGASHSHSSGPVGMVIPGEYDHASPLVQTLAYEKSSGADRKYLDRVEQAIADAVFEANGKRQAAQCGVGKGIEETVAFNRRFRMKNGLTHTHPGQGNPDIVEPAGPTDPEVGVIGAWDASGKLLGCVVNFACHATTSPGGISANYIYYIENAIRGFFGDGRDRCVPAGQLRRRHPGGQPQPLPPRVGRGERPTGRRPGWGGGGESLAGNGQRKPHAGGREGQYADQSPAGGPVRSG